MKISIRRSSLANVIGQVQNAVSHKTTLPILSNFLITAQDQEITISATDLELGMSGKVAAQVEEPGTITLPARKFCDMIHDFPESEIKIESKKNQMVMIECEKSYFKIMSLPPEDFPKFPELDEKEALSIGQGVLKEMIQLTSFSISNDTTRYALNGIFFLVKGKILRMVATDGRRLAFIERQLPIASGLERSAIIPTKTVHELSKWLAQTQDSGTEAEVKIIFGENQLLFVIPNLTMFSRVIEGEFPNYEQVIPNESPHKVKFSREKFLFATKRTSLLTSQESQSIKLEFLKDRVILSKVSPEWGEAREEVEVNNEGKEISIGFNPYYLMDVLKALPQEEVTLEVTAADKPGVIRTPNKYTYLVLPMQIT